MSSKPLRQDKGGHDADIAVLERPASPSAASDLDEFEKFFREQFAAPAGSPQENEAASAPVAAAQPVPADDPLMAELARIVGQEVRVATAAPPKMPAAADPFAYSPAAMREAASHGQDDPLRAFEEELRRFDAEQRARSAPPADSQPIELPIDAIAAHHGDLPGYSDDTAFAGHDHAGNELRGAYSEPAATVAPGIAPALSEKNYSPLPGDELSVPPPADFQEEAPPRSRKIMAILGVAGVVALAGVVGTLGFGRSTKPAGEAPMIAAKSTPAKEKPANPGGVEISGQDRQVLANRAVEPKGAASVVNKEEQPVDLNQTPKRDAARVVLPQAGAGAPAAPTPPVQILMPSAAGQANATAPTSAPVAQPPQAGASQAPAVGVEPRRVRSVRISGEGEGAQPPPAAAAPAAPVARPPSLASAPPPAALTQTAQPAQAAPPKSEARPGTATRPAAPTPTTTPQPARQAAAPRPAPPAPAATESADGSPSPMSLRPPTGANPTTRVATASPPATQAAPSGGTGGFAVQLRAAPSESEARASASELRQRHAGALGGSTPGVREATVNGRTVYRVRVGGLSRDAATSMCNRIKADGGSCFVAAN